MALAILGLMGAGAFGYWYAFMYGIVSTDDARLDADRVDLAPSLAGRLDRLLVKEGDHVKQGQVVFELDPSLFKVALASAQANLDAEDASLQMRKALLAKVLHGTRIEEIRMAQDSERQALARESLARTQLARAKQLYTTGAFTKERMDQATTAWIVAHNARNAALHRLGLLLHGSRQEDINAAKASVDAARMNLRAAEMAVKRAQTYIKHLVVRAPFSGPVVRVWRRPGAMLAPGTPVVTIVNPQTLHVAANIQEKDLGKIGVGAPVDISIDAFPDHTLHGKVTRIMRVTNSTFSLFPVDSSNSTFIKVSQRIPIRIDLDVAPQLPLGPGLSVEVRIRENGHGSPSGTGSARAGKQRKVRPTSVNVDAVARSGRVSRRGVHDAH